MLHVIAACLSLPEPPPESADPTAAVLAVLVSASRYAAMREGMVGWREH